MAESNAKRLDRLEVGRGCAAMLIVLYHCTAIVQSPAYHGTVPWGGLFSIGGFGVDFFFVLSGFIIAYIHGRDVGQSPRLGSYLRKRVARIYPPYWAVLAFIVPVYFLNPSFGEGTETQPGRLLSSILLTPHPEAPVLPVAWSLRHEVLFYAAFALLIWRPRWGAAAFAAWQTFVLTSLWRADPTHYLNQWLGDLRNLNFAFGMVAAAIVIGRRGKAVHLPPGTATALVGLGALGAVALGLAGHLRWLQVPWAVHTLTYGLASALAVVGLASLDLAASRRPPAWARLIGEASYSIYLTHYPLLSAYAKVGRRIGLNQALPAEVLFLVLAAAATGTALMFYRWIEVPLLAWVRRRWVSPAGPGVA